MDRRGFLKGVFGGVTAAGVIVAASPTDIAAFASPLLREAPLVLDAAPTFPIVNTGEHLYNARGELVAFVTDVRVTLPKIDVTSFGGGESVSMPGLATFDIYATGLGTLEWDGRSRPILRGISAYSSRTK